MEPCQRLLTKDLDHQRLRMLTGQLCELSLDDYLIQKSAASANGSRRIPLATITQPSSSSLSDFYLVVRQIKELRRP